jgi:hypothetical protein
MAGESPGRARTDDVALAIGGRAGRARSDRRDRELDGRIEHAQRVVVRHVLLRLAGFEEGEREIWRLRHSESPRSFSIATHILLVITGLRRPGHDD